MVWVSVRAMVDELGVELLLPGDSGLLSRWAFLDMKGRWAETDHGVSILFIDKAYLGGGGLLGLHKGFPVIDRVFRGT